MDLEKDVGLGIGFYEAEVDPGLFNLDFGSLKVGDQFDALGVAVIEIDPVDDFLVVTDLIRADPDCDFCDRVRQDATLKN